MIDFTNLSYLKEGTPKQREAYVVLTHNAVMGKLTIFHPVLTGTIPLNIDIPGSDLDIVCQWSDPGSFRDTLIEAFSDAAEFRIHQKTIRGNETIIATFKIEDFVIEVFGQQRPVTEQEAYRHLLIEYQILLTKGEVFRKQVVALKLQGHKTEPAFAKLLGLPCVNPYVELLEVR